MPRRVPLAPALLLYLGMAWTIAALAALRPHDLAHLAGAFFALAERDLAALGAAVHALAPATPVAAAAVTGVLLLDLLLLWRALLRVSPRASADCASSRAEGRAQ